MSLLPPAQISVAQKANLDTFFGLTNKAFDGFEKLVQLNLDAAKSTLTDIQDNARNALSVKGPRERLALQARITQPFAEKALADGRHVYEIAASTQAGFAKVTEARYEARSRRMQTLVDDIAKSSPTGERGVLWHDRNRGLKSIAQNGVPETVTIG